MIEKERRNTMVLDFSRISKNDIMTAGGKGANLGEMTSAGINVPKGFVLTADAYKGFLEANNLQLIFKKSLPTIMKKSCTLFTHVPQR